MSELASKGAARDGRAGVAPIAGRSWRGAASERRESIALGVIAAVAAARAMLSISPALRFDTDPAVIPGALAGIGPSASLLLDSLGLIGVAMLLAGRAGRRSEAAAALDRGRDSTPAQVRGRVRSIGLAPLLVLVPLPGFLATLLGESGGLSDLWRGASWLAAALAAASIVGRGRAARTIVGAVLLGAIAAMLVRGASQVLVEHPATVEHFEKNRDAFLSARGWTPGSPAALSYERRLRQVEASGWFGLANVYSGVAVAGAFAFAGLAMSARRLAPTARDSAARSQDSAAHARDRTATASSLICAVAAIGAVAIVVVNGGKGAIATLLIGGAAAGVLGLARGRGPRVIPALLCTLVVAGFVAAFVRGAILGETPMEERSLLFRWYYILGAMRIVVAHPWSGVGAGGFQDAYLVSRPWFSPEEVTSSHSAWLDWLAAFGVGGAALVVLSLALLVRSLRGAMEPDDSAPIEVDASSAKISALAVAGGAVLALALTSRTDLDAASLSSRAVASLAAIVTARCAASLLARSRSRAVEIGFAVAALAMLVHGQVDMDFWHPGAVWWCWLLLGAAACSRPPRPRSMDRVVKTIVVVASITGAASLAVTSVRIGAQERAVERAAQRLEQAAAANLPLPRGPAAEALEDAVTIEPRNELVWQAAVEQLILAAAQLDQHAAPRRALVERAVRAADDSFAARPCAATAKFRLDAHHVRLIERLGGAAEVARRLESPPPGARLDDDAEGRAIEAAAREYLRRDPRSASAWTQCAEILWLLGDSVGAADAAREALRVDTSYRLDPLRQLPDRTRAWLTKTSRAPEAANPPAP
ncbi:MAG: O-antigen ligase family protein [Phycisphaerae bacterium]|nr:O-antigen ligase family protein [Phycisphaerae bacterium]